MGKTTAAAAIIESGSEEIGSGMGLVGKTPPAQVVHPCAPAHRTEYLSQLTWSCFGQREKAESRLREELWTGVSMLAAHGNRSSAHSRGERDDR